MLRYTFRLSVFQKGQPAEKLDSVQEFSDATELANALVSFAAMQSLVRTKPQVIPLYARRGKQISLPPAKEGYGPETYVVIEEMTQIA